MATPYYTADDLIKAIKRKILMPIAQQTFSEEDILDFVNEEMTISMIPDILQYKEEYFVTTKDVALVDNQQRYGIPERAIGLKLRDLFWKDTSGNIYDMTRVNEEDTAFFQNNITATRTIHKYYLQGNDVVLAPTVQGTTAGFLLFVYYLRPNNIVKNERAFTTKYFSKTITVDNALLTNGDVLTINNVNYICGVTFMKGNTSAITASNIKVAIAGNTFLADVTQATNSAILYAKYTSLNTALPYTQSVTVDQNTLSNGDAIVIGQYNYICGTDFTKGLTATETADNINNAVLGKTGNSITYQISGSMILISYTSKLVLITSASSGMDVQQSLNIEGTDVVPSNITLNSKTDFIQCVPGFKTRVFDIVPLSIAGNLLTYSDSDVPSDMQIGDYICSQYETIIPQIPPDLHNSLAERAASRILASLGDMQGYQISQAKIQELQKAEGIISDNRVEGSPIKVLNRFSLLRINHFGIRRRY